MALLTGSRGMVEGRGRPWTAARFVTQGAEPHRSAFLVGKVKDVVPSPFDPRKDRYLIQFSEYARVNLPDVWKGDRNPVKYTTLGELGIDPSILPWKAIEPNMVVEPPHPVVAPTTPAPLTMADAKKGLALTFGVAPEAIEITIRG